MDSTTPAQQTYEVDARGLFCRHCGQATWLHSAVPGVGRVCGPPIHAPATPAQDSTQAESELVERLGTWATVMREKDAPGTDAAAAVYDEAADRITRLEAALGEAREALEKARHRLLKEGFTPNDPTVRATISALTALGGGGQ